MNKSKIIKSSLARRNLDRFLSNRLSICGLVIVLLLIFAAIFAPLLTKYDPSFIDVSKRFLPPSAEHLLGTDNVGRDIFARVIYGGRISIFIGVVSALGASMIGTILGCFAGYFGGRADDIIIYISEMFMSFPHTILILILVSFIGQGISNLIIIFSMTGWTGSMRIIRSKIMTLREESFVECCRANGVSGLSIMFNHLLPNARGPIFVNITLSISAYVLSESGLSFIGLGVPQSIPTWGNIINSAKSLLIIQNHPVMWLAPGIAISILVLGINFFGDGLRDVFDQSQ